MQPRPSDVRAPRLEWRITLLALGTFALGTDAFLIAGILPQLAAGLDVGLEAAGQVVSSYALAYALGAPVVITLVAKWPRGRVVVWALGAFTVANLLSALAPTFPIMMGVRVGAGLIAALFTPSAYALAAQVAHPDRRASALATVSLGLAVSTVIGVPVGSWIGQHLGWRMSFILIATVSGLGVIGLMRAGFLRASFASTIEPPSFKKQLAPMAHWPVLLSLLPMLLWSTAYFTMYTYLAAFLNMRVPSVNAAKFLLLFGLGCLVGNRIGGAAADRFGTSLPIIWCLVGSTLGQAILAIGTAAPLIVAILLFGWGVCGWANFAPQQIRLLTVEPSSGPLVLSLNNSMNYLGSALGAAIGALTLSLTSLRWLPVVAGTVYVLAIVTFEMSRRATLEAGRNL